MKNKALLSALINMNASKAFPRVKDIQEVFDLSEEQTEQVLLIAKSELDLSKEDCIRVVSIEKESDTITIVFQTIKSFGKPKKELQILDIPKSSIQDVITINNAIEDHDKHMKLSKKMEQTLNNANVNFSFGGFFDACGVMLNNSSVIGVGLWKNS